MAKKEQEKGYTEEIEHVQATRPEPWPGIQGRSEEHEAEPDTGSEASGGRRSDSTDAQRQLEREMHEKTRR
jgi:hypothetical protein